MDSPERVDALFANIGAMVIEDLRSLRLAAESA